MLELVVASLLFSLSFGLIKSQVASLDPLLVALVRLTLAFVAFAPFLRRRDPRAALELMAIGSLQFGLMYCLYIASYRYLAAHQVAILTTATPVHVAVFAGLLDGRFNRRAALAAVLSLAGGLALVLDRGAFAVSVRGFALVQGANACFALGQVLYRRARYAAPDARTFGWAYLGGLLVPLGGLLLASASGRHLGASPATLRQWMSLAYLGLVPSALGFYLWNRGVTRVSAPVAGVMNNLKVPAGVLLAWLLFGEGMVIWRVAASVALMLAALAVARRA